MAPINVLERKCKRLGEAEAQLLLGRLIQWRVLDGSGHTANVSAITLNAVVCQRRNDAGQGGVGLAGDVEGLG